MAKHGKINLDKSLGQHFLNDQYVLQKITDTINSKVSQEENIIEVGPGAGALTAFFYKRKILFKQWKINLDPLLIGKRKEIADKFMELSDLDFPWDDIKIPTNTNENKGPVRTNYPTKDPNKETSSGGLLAAGLALFTLLK